MTFQWQKLSPTEFHQLQEYISYSSKKLKDVLEDLHISCDEPMVYDGFRKFMDSYMEAEIPEELCKHLFLSLMKKPIGPPTTTGKDYHHVRDVAAVTATQTVCAPITHLGADIHIDKGEKHQGFVEKIHGLTEKLQGLGLHGEKGHSRHDSGESGKRSRAGSTSASTHPAVAVTANPAVEKSLAAGDDSTPDVSTHSRSSSKKSNHSVNTIHNEEYKEFEEENTMFDSDGEETYFITNKDVDKMLEEQSDTHLKLVSKLEDENRTLKSKMEHLTSVQCANSTIEKQETRFNTETRMSPRYC
ncbi:diacylglycerol kinase (ATP) [Mytilus galloprovincialis]|uniref:Diacylglycerol kinase (ATP) n=1 Tax=Mytilus galloprovincialis TaxID=29158 RepID=A0A8B6GCN4_MYTGA|nr:diacylglycerol kinase (ATP) [Mytilus galloprovincialis]